MGKLLSIREAKRSKSHPCKSCFFKSCHEEVTPTCYTASGAYLQQVNQIGGGRTASTPLLLRSGNRNKLAVKHKLLISVSMPKLLNRYVQASPSLTASYSFQRVPFLQCLMSVRYGHLVYCRLPILFSAAICKAAMSIA